MPQKWLKTLMLLLLLGLPIVLYLFLQGFGENKYQIPVYYEGGVDNKLRPDCADTPGQHFISNFVKPETGLSDLLSGETILVFGFVQSECSIGVQEELARIVNQFKQISEFKAITLTSDTSVTSDHQMGLKKRYIIPEPVWTQLFYPDSDQLINCGFNLRNDCELSKQLILVDQQSRIRGYYMVEDAEELDRLTTEINILLNQ